MASSCEAEEPRVVTLYCGPAMLVVKLAAVACSECPPCWQFCTSSTYLLAVCISSVVWKHWHYTILLHFICQ